MCFFVFSHFLLQGRVLLFYHHCSKLIIITSSTSQHFFIVFIIDLVILLLFHILLTFIRFQHDHNVSYLILFLYSQTLITSSVYSVNTISQVQCNNNAISAITSFISSFLNFTLTYLINSFVCTHID